MAWLERRASTCPLCDEPLAGPGIEALAEHFAECRNTLVGRAQG